MANGYGGALEQTGRLGLSRRPVDRKHTDDHDFGLDVRQEIRDPPSGTVASVNQCGMATP